VPPGWPSLRRILKMNLLEKFNLGNLVITPAAMNELDQNSVIDSLIRHSRCDWGDVSESDGQENDFSLKEGLRIFSVYHDSNEIKFWIITEADRSATTILLPDDY
jgi:hypothetical protein